MVTYSEAVAELQKRELVYKLLGSTEVLLTHKQGFGLVLATPLQRAICRVIDGFPLGELAEEPEVVAALGSSTVPEARPQEVILLSGIRAAKSMIASAAAIRATQVCDLTNLTRGEVPRVSVASLTRDLAQATFGHLRGALTGPLSSLLLQEPTSDSFLLRHPTGTPIELKVVAGARAGSSLVSRWCATVIFDEAPRMQGSEDGVINLDHSRTAVLGRLLPGAQIISLGSPWAPFGPVYELYREHWGHPSKEVVVFKAPGPAMNPNWWTPQRCAALEKKDPVAYRTDVLAEFVDAEEAMYADSTLRACARQSPMVVPYIRGHEYAAAMDPATRGNAWTLVVATKRDNVRKIVCAKQWQGSPHEPLKPTAVLAEIADILKSYQVDLCSTDQFAGDVLADVADGLGLTLSVKPWTASEKVRLFTHLGTLLLENQVELPPDENVIQDLKAVRKVTVQNGVSIRLPKTGDGRHADYAPAVALALAQWVDEYAEPAPLPGSRAHAEYLARKIEEEEELCYLEESGKDWWV